MPTRYLVTSGLPYSNGRLHVGHIAGAYLPADTYVRYLRAAGRDVRFICGSDDNGVAIEISARQQNKTPQEVSTHFNQRQKADFAGLRIDFDVYGGTHQPGYWDIHRALSQDFFKRIYERGFFTKRRTRQLFDPQINRFLPDRYVEGTCYHPDCRKPGAHGDQCSSCGRLIDALLLIEPKSVITGGPTEVRETTHWYLRLNDFEQPLRDWLNTKQGIWRPSVLNFALGQIKQGLPERSMTRDIEWGIPVPLDDPDAAGKVLFVWFDAPIGYVSFTAALCEQRGERREDYQKWWCDPDTSIVHFIGEDNTVFHTLIWPAMLMAEQQHKLPAHVVANNYLNFKIGGGEEEKISKSRTPQESPVWIEEYLKRYDPDALRYYLTAIAPEAARTFFDPAHFIQRNNSELCDVFGNFVNRPLTFVARYFDNKVPDASAATDVDRALVARGAAALEKVGACIEGFRFKAGLEELMSFASACNEYFQIRAPWSSRKTNMADCAASIGTSVHAVHHLAILAAPFMPGAAERIVAMLGLDAPALRWQPPAPPATGRALGQAQILFTKLEGEEL
ncbi:MAG: Methionine--tRNA ligase [Phycisphaerae bacterium]|nr:Methionine--tRNA ligase [Phycisphaerae bacterium]